jgi:hypothetical protein
VSDNLLFHCSLNAQHVLSDNIAYHQELLNCNYSLEAPDDERYRSKHVGQSRNNGIINCPTQLHLVGPFCEICIMMHGSMNVKFGHF